MNKATYETKRVECWDKAIELRRKHRRRIWEVQRRGGLLVHGIGYCQGLLAGMGDFAVTELTTTFRGIMSNREETLKCLETVEAKGFGRDMCSSMRMHYGTLLRGVAIRTPEGRSLRPDIVFQINVCNSLPKACQLFSEHLEVPACSVDLPSLDTPTSRAYFVDQMLEGIDWLENVTARKYDDEKLIEAVRNEWLSLNLTANVWYLNRTVPAPLSMRQMSSLYIPVVLARHSKEVVEFCRILLEEVQSRVENHIASQSVERARLVHEGIPPFYYMNILRYPGQYGALFVGSDVLWAYGVWSNPLEGGWEPFAPPDWAGPELRTREEALQSLADLYMGHRAHVCWPGTLRCSDVVNRARGLKADGVVFHMDRGCKGLQASILEAKIVLEEQGIPTLLYEGSSYDPRDFNEVEVLDRFDSFLESLGLTKLDAGPPGKDDEEAMEPGSGH